MAPRFAVSKAWFRSEFEGDAYYCGAARIETADSGCSTIGAIETRERERGRERDLASCSTPSRTLTRRLAAGSLRLASNRLEGVIPHLLLANSIRGSKILSPGYLQRQLSQLQTSCVTRQPESRAPIRMINRRARFSKTNATLTQLGETRVGAYTVASIHGPNTTDERLAMPVAGSSCR